MPKETVNHPAHYGGADNPYEAIKVIEAWTLNFNLGNTTKYIARAGRKDGATRLEDLRKARWYLDREIAAIATSTASAGSDILLRVSISKIPQRSRRSPGRKTARWRKPSASS